MTTNVNLLKRNIPPYLQDSDFYRNLGDDIGESFTISFYHFKADTHIKTITDLDCLLSTLRFWGVESCPVDVLQWAWLNPVDTYESIFMQYWQELTYLRDIHTVMSAPRTKALNVALNLSCMNIVEFLLGQGLSYDKESAIIAASTGNLAVLNAIDETDFIFAQDILAAAASHGQLNILTEYLRRYPKVSQDKLCLAAAEHGQLACLEFLFPPNSDDLTVQLKICECATKHYQVACFQYACTPFMPLSALSLRLLWTAPLIRRKLRVQPLNVANYQLLNVSLRIMYRLLTPPHLLHAMDISKYCNISEVMMFCGVM
eukprot:gene8497-10081_t